MLFKRRSKYGEFIDQNLGHGGQEKVRAASGLTPNTITRACNDEEYRPKKGIMNLLLSAARQLTGKNVDKNDFWPPM